MTDQSRLTWALIVSVLLHGLLLTLLPLIRRAHIEIPSPPPLLDVDVVTFPKAAPPAAKVPAPAQQVAPVQQPPPVLVPERQLVSPPDSGEEKEPEKTRFLSDRNNSVKEEVVHRAEPAAGDPDAKPAPPPEEPKAAKAEPAPAPPKPAAAPKPQAPPRPQPARESAHTQAASLPKLDQLLPPSGDLIREGLVQPQEAPAAAAPQQQASVQRNDLLRHGDPWRSGGRGGSLDFLPSVREGDITMLNTKAEQFAPFVRRVAVRVFENFRILLRRSVDGGRAEAVEEYATIEAIMDKQGRLLSIQARDRSANAALSTDRNLQAATREGFFDRNPPPGAESSDGNIHFLFDARVGLMTDPGRGIIGYRALFQAGLL
jgi:hypothetical protein